METSDRDTTARLQKSDPDGSGKKEMVVGAPVIDHITKTGAVDHPRATTRIG